MIIRFHFLHFRAVSAGCPYHVPTTILRRLDLSSLYDFVGKYQEKVQSEKRFPLKKTEVGKTGTDTKKTFRKPNEQLFSQ